ncbi:MAG: hypothetical protein QOK05_1083 [Chloroflexota bacterium]|nr:hypothetical protein [Chloroflexota bacterium]
MRRAALGVALASLLALAGLAVHAGPARAVCAYADGATHVALLVQHGNGHTLKQCLGFPVGAMVSGEQVLSASGVEYVTYPFGGSLGDAVCQVDYEPATPPGGFTRDNCLGNPYWGVWAARDGGAWSTASHGVSNTTFQDGDAEGLRYGNGSAPPASSTGICPAPPRPTGSPTPAPPAPSSAPPTANGNPGATLDPAGRDAGSGDRVAAVGSSPSTGSSAGAVAPAPGNAAAAEPTPAPGSSATPPRPAPPASTPTGPGWVGWAFAGSAGAALVLLLAGQLIMGRIRS